MICAISEWFDTYGYAAVADRLLTGALPTDAGDVAHLERMRVTRVLNLVQDREYADGEHEAVLAAYAEAEIVEERVALVDFGGLPAAQLEAGVTLVHDWLRGGEVVYLHCRAGRQRSASFAAGAVALFEDVDLPEALRRVRNRKPGADPLPHQRDDLAAWWEQR